MATDKSTESDIRQVRQTAREQILDPAQSIEELLKILHRVAAVGDLLSEAAGSERDAYLDTMAAATLFTIGSMIQDDAYRAAELADELYRSTGDAA